MKTYRLELGIGRDRQIRSLTFCETISSHDFAAALARADSLTETAPAWVIANVARVLDEDGTILWSRARNADLDWGEADRSRARATTAAPAFEPRTLTRCAGARGC